MPRGKWHQCALRRILNCFYFWTLFLNCSVASSTHGFFNSRKHSLDGIKFIIISNNKNFITVLWVKYCLLISWRDISLLWGSGLSSGWAFFVQSLQSVFTGFSLHVLYCLHLFPWDLSEEYSPEICISWPCSGIIDCSFTTETPSRDSHSWYKN